MVKGLLKLHTLRFHNITNDHWGRPGHPSVTVYEDTTGTSTFANKLEAHGKMGPDVCVGNIQHFSTKITEIIRVFILHNAGYIQNVRNVIGFQDVKVCSHILRS